MNLLGQVAGLIWTLAAFFLLASVVAAPFVALVQRCRARGRRLFRDEPLERLRSLHQSNVDHSQDAL